LFKERDFFKIKTQELLIRIIDKIFLTGCKMMLSSLMNGVIHQMMLNERHPNVQPHDKAVIIPHKNVKIM
jgi:hypothetical protein